MPENQKNGTSIAVGNGNSVFEDGVADQNAIGHDNPAFENEVDAPTESGSSPASRLRHENGDDRSNGDHVEMVPLNPTVTDAPSTPATTNGTSATNNNNNNNNNNTTATSKKGTKQNDKAALDNIYSEYFRPVNTRRKLLRGEKLYVTRDQRAHNRSWKWIAFWGGVFTFLAAALLAGILAATGIIISHSEPLFGTSHSLVASNHSEWNDTETTTATAIAKDSTDLNFHPSPNFSEATTTMNTDMVHDFDNSLDEESKVNSKNPWMHSSTEFQTLSTIDPIVHWLITTGNDLQTTGQLSTATASVISNNATSDRGRSLDDEAPMVGPSEETTLFPALTDGVDEVIVNVTTIEHEDTTLFPMLQQDISDNFTSLLPTESSDIERTSSLNDTIDGDSLFPSDNVTLKTTSTPIDNVTEMLYTTTDGMYDLDLDAVNFTKSTTENTTGDWNDTQLEDALLHAKPNASVDQSTNATRNETSSTEGRHAVSSTEDASNVTFPVDDSARSNDTMSAPANESSSTHVSSGNVTLFDGALFNETSTSRLTLDSGDGNDNVTVADATFNDTVWDVAAAINDTLIDEKMSGVDANDTAVITTNWNDTTVRVLPDIFPVNSSQTNGSHSRNATTSEEPTNVTTSTFVETTTATLTMTLTTMNSSTDDFTAWNETSNVTEL